MGCGSSARHNGDAEQCSCIEADWLEPKDDLFGLCNIELYRRPDAELVRSLWVDHDRNGDMRLGRDEADTFLGELVARWGSGGKVPPRAMEKFHELFRGNDRLEWEQLRAALWDITLPGCLQSPLVLIKLRAEFWMLDPSRTGKAPSELCYTAAKKLLLRNRCDAVTVEKELRCLNWDTGDLTFLSWLRSFGPVYERHVDDWGHLLAGRHRLSLPEKIDSFAPERNSTPVELLACGDEAFGAMIREIQRAESEILMSWFEFCWEVPALRGDLGKLAWDDPNGTLPPVLQRKANAGVKIRILLWDAPTPVDLGGNNQKRTDEAVSFFQKVHTSIEVMAHPPHFPVLYTHHQKFVVVDRRVCILGGLDWAGGRYDTLDHPIFDPDHRTHPGIDYCAPPPKELWQDQLRRREGHVDRQKIPRSGWQDLCLTVWGPAANDCATNFIERWNYAMHDAHIADPDGKVDNVTEMKCSAARAPELEKPPPEAQAVMRVRIVRSLAKWSGGLATPERSIYDAWVQAISQAEHYIYIEQQYFITDTGDHHVVNQLGKAILKRIEAAIAAGRNFRVYVLVPMTVQAEAVAHFTRRSLLQGPSSLWALVSKMLHGTEKDPSEYISVCRLHSAAKSPAGEWKEATCFVHSKACIVDDRIAIIGSANVNDRSFSGDGDSEIGAILWDDVQTGEALMDSSTVEVGVTVRNFRIKLWSAWLGLRPDCGEWASPSAVADPVHSNTYHGVWRATAAHNQKLLESVFDWVPSNSIRNQKEWSFRRKSAAPPHEPERLAKVPPGLPERLTEKSWQTEGLRGQLVEFPLHFLGDVDGQGWLEYFSSTLPLLKQHFL